MAFGFGFGAGRRNRVFDGEPSPNPMVAQRAAQRVLASAARGTVDIAAVMQSPPTITSTGNTSSLSGASNANGMGMYQLEDGAVFRPIGCIIGQTSSSRTTYAMTLNVNTGTKRAAGGGFATQTSAPAVDFVINSGSGTVAIYVTDVLTGVRRRVTADDYVGSATFNHYHKLDFGSSRDRIIEWFVAPNPGGTAFRGFNCTTGYTMVAPTFSPTDINIVIIGDSHVDQTGSGNTNRIALCYTNYLAAKLGTPRRWAQGAGGTGFANPVGSSGTYIQRLGNGDLSTSFVGSAHLVILASTTNDGEALNANFTDAMVQEATRLTVIKAMADQPNALIFVPGPFSRTVAPTATTQVISQARYDAIKAGAEAAAGGDPRVIFLDNSPAGSPDIPEAQAATIIGPDGTHLSNAGMSIIGYKRADEIIAACMALAA